MFQEICDRIAREDKTLDTLDFTLCLPTRKKLVPVINALVAHPNVVRDVWMGSAKLNDEDGAKLALVVAASNTIRSLNIPCNNFTERTFFALARALETNRSLEVLDLYMNRLPIDRFCVDSAFAAALRSNPRRSPKSAWRLYEPAFDDVDFWRLIAPVQ